jgi:hypothetical protein
MHRPGRETTAAPVDAPLIEVGGNGLDTHGPSIDADGQIEDQAHDTRFVLVIAKAFFSFAPRFSLTMVR